jgi:hypothetical protein
LVLHVDVVNTKILVCDYQRASTKGLYEKMDEKIYLKDELLWKKEETYAKYQKTWREWLAIVIFAMEGSIGPRM